VYTQVEATEIFFLFPSIDQIYKNEKPNMINTILLNENIKIIYFKTFILAQISISNDISKKRRKIAIEKTV